MEKDKQLAFDDDFLQITGIVMNNWFALKVVVNHSDDSVETRNFKLLGLCSLLKSCTESIINNHSILTEASDTVEDYFDDHFNTLIEDNSCEEVLSELVKYYNMLLNNNKEHLKNAMATFQDKRNIFTNVEYDLDKGVNVPKAEVEIKTESQNSMEITEGGFVENEWETVRRKRRN